MSKMHYLSFTKFQKSSSAGGY